jgi:hypothetical protein
MEITLDKYEEYFRNLATKYSKIKDFCQIDMFDFNTFVNDLRGNKWLTPLMVLETYNIGTIAQKMDNIHDVFDGALVILDRIDLHKATPALKTTFLGNCEAITKQIRLKMLLDKKKLEYFLSGLIPESMDIAKTDLIAGNYMGYRLNFTIENAIDDKLDGNWNFNL